MCHSTLTCTRSAVPALCELSILPHNRPMQVLVALLVEEYTLVDQFPSYRRDAKKKDAQG